MDLPSRLGHQDFSRHEALQKIEGDSQPTGATQALNGGNFSFLNQRVVVAEHQLAGALDETVQTVNGQVFFVQFSLKLFSLKSYILGFLSEDIGGFSHTLEHIRFFIIITIGSDAQVDFLGVFVGFVGQGRAENRIGRGQGQVGEQVLALGGAHLVRNLVDAIHIFYDFINY